MATQPDSDDMCFSYAAGQTSALVAAVVHACKLAAWSRFSGF